MAATQTLTAMRARLLLNLLLLLIVIGLGVLYLTRDSEQQEAPERLSDLDTGTVSRIRVEQTGEPVIELQRTNGDWRLLAPIETDADDGRVASILQLAESTSDSRFAASGQTLERYGLSPPQLSVEFDNQRFVIGDPGALDEHQRYVLHRDQVHLISDHLYQRLAAPLTYYVNSELIPRGQTITHIRLPDGELSKYGEDWHAEPASLSDQPTETVAAWQRARAIYIKRHDGDQADYQGEAVIEFAGAEPLHYKIMTSDSQLVLANPALGLQYHLDQGLAQQLLLKPADETAVEVP